MIQLIEGFKSRWRNFYYKSRGLKLKGYVWMRKIEIPRNFSYIEIESPCALDRGVVLLCSGEATAHPKIYIGAHSYINRNTLLDSINSLRIGQHCAIGPGCYITDHDHGTDLDFSPLLQPMLAKPTRIGDRVWIGANATILKGVTIGDDVIIGAGSVVTKDIPAKTIAVGMPAKVVKFRDKDAQVSDNDINNCKEKKL